MSEGLATLYAYTLNDVIFPSKRSWEDFVMNVFDITIRFDVDGLRQPLNEYADTPALISQKSSQFNTEKAAIVLRMLRDAIGGGTFEKGVGYYLTEMQFTSASPEDLFRNLQRALNEDFPANSLDVQASVDPWFSLQGFPVVTVSKTGQGLHFTQATFRQTHDELFGIPINYATASSPGMEKTAADLWMTTKEAAIEVELNTDWVVVNLRDTGYYVVNYSEELWALIVAALIENHEAIHFLNRGSFFANFHRLITGKLAIEATLLLDLMRSMIHEKHHHVWIRAEQALVMTENRLRGSDLHRLFLEFLRPIMTVAYDEVPLSNQRARNIVNRFSCLAGVQNCLDDSLGALTEETETGSSAFGFEFRCNALMFANKTIWEKSYNRALSFRPGGLDRFILFRDLACTQDREVAKFFLNQSIDFTSNKDRSDREDILNFLAITNTIGFDAVVEFLKEHHEVINER
jgi:ERAP1-like C-terminal domain/Peptidase family M1 domain